MKDVLKWILIGGGLAAVFFRDQISAVLAPATAAAPTPAAGTPAAAAPAVATDATGTKARMLAAAQGDAIYTANGGRMSAYEWNFYYSLMRGVPAPDPATLGISDPAMLISLDEYFTAANAHGLSGPRAGRPAARRIAARAWEA